MIDPEYHKKLEESVEELQDRVHALEEERDLIGAEAVLFRRLNKLIEYKLKNVINGSTWLSSAAKIPVMRVYEMLLRDINQSKIAMLNYTLDELLKKDIFDQWEEP